MTRSGILTGLVERLTLLAAVAAVIAALVVGAPLDAAKKKRKPTKKKGPEATAVPRPADPYRVTLATDDGVSLAATWRPVPGQPDAPAVLLIHDFSRDRRQWEPLAADFLARGLATLAIDLRAHGESLRKAGTAAPLHLSPTLQTRPNAFPRDVEAACKWLREKTPKVGVMGLSLGGNLAVLATASAWADTAVVVSANIAKLGLLAGGRPTKPRATLVLASDRDPGRADSAKVLDATGEAPKRTTVYSGASHSLGLLNDHADAKEAALAWLAERLGATPHTPPTPAPAPPPEAPPTPTPTAPPAP